MIEISENGAGAIIADFGDAPQVVTKALVRALNRSIGSGRTVMVREIARDLGLKSKDVRDAMKTKEASLSRPEASLGTGTKRIPLIDFRAKGQYPSRGKGRGVSYRIGQSSGRLPHAFIAIMSSGHRGVFERTPGKFMRGSTSRQAIHQKFGPSLGRVFEKYRPMGVARVLEAFEKNFDHELSFARSQGAPAPAASGHDA